MLQNYHRRENFRGNLIFMITHNQINKLLVRRKIELELIQWIARVVSCLGLPSSSQQCSKWFHLSSEKQHRHVIPSVANGQRFFHLSQLQRRFCHENYMVLARTQLFHQLPLLKCLYTWCQCTQRTFWYCMHDCFGHFAHVKFFANKIYIGFKVFMGENENWISWKFNPWNISPTKISASTVCTDCLHNYHQYTTFDTQDQYTLWQTLCSTVYWHRSCAVRHVARPHPLLIFKNFNYSQMIPSCSRTLHTSSTLYRPLLICNFLMISV